MFKICFVVLWIIYVSIRIPYEKLHKNSKKEVVIKKSKERLLVLVNFIGLVLCPFIWVFSPWLDLFNFYLPDLARILGVLCMIISLLFFWWIHKTLGANWSPLLEIREKHELIVSGPYKRIRHPMYTQIWLWVISQFLVTSNYLAGLSGIIAWSIVYFSRVKTEEQMMIKKFGNTYKEYMKVTGRLFPKFS